MTEPADKLGRWLAIGGAIAVVAIVAASIATTGTPLEQRRARIDEGRIEDLEEITKAAHAWAQSEGSLPPDLATLANAPGSSLRIDDRDGGRYEYARIDANRFRICADFDTDTAEFPSHHYSAGSPEWDHPAGRHCFTRTNKKEN